MKKQAALLLVLSLLCVGCDAAKDNTLTLALHSKAFATSINPKNAPALDTYHLLGNGDVPYVKLSQYCAALGDSMTYNPYSVAKNEGVYTVSYALSEEEGAKKVAAFSFDPKSQQVAFFEGARNQFRFYASLDPYADGLDSVYQPNKEKTTFTRLWEKRTIDVKKYGLAFFEQGDEIYAPFGLIQAVFSERAAGDGPKPMIFNGRDYYRTTSTGNKASCLSSKLYFRYVDQYLLELAMAVTDAVIPTTMDFAPVTAGSGEKYRFETEKVVTPEFTPSGASAKSKALPDFKIRLVLTGDAKGTYSFLDANTGKELNIPTLNIVTRSVQYFEDDDSIIIGLMPIKEGALGDMMRIHKNETFYRKGERSKEYAVYDYNLVRLHFGEFYGLHDRKVSFDTLIAPYQSQLCSKSYDDYNDAMTRFLYETVDDGHTSVDNYSLFGSKTYDATEKEKAKNHYGYRLGGLVNLRSSLLAYRNEAKLSAGYQVVGDTAYLAFDAFISGANKVTDYTESPNVYVTSNTMAFAYSALKDVATNHKEVKRVVYDLTCNGGGAIAAMPFLLATMSDDPTLTMTNYYAGERITAHYKVDLNGDGVFGGKDDTYKGKYDFYILTSPLSFSCGNAFPGYAKALGCARIIGLRSGGGGSMVDNAVTVSGFEFRSSSMMTFMMADGKGGYVENDAGISVDASIPMDLFYNREKLNSTLDQLNKK